MEINLEWVFPDGTITHKGKEYRVAFGNPFHPNSLYGSDPKIIPWSARHMNAHARMIEQGSSHELDDYWFSLADRMKASPGREDISVIPFPYVHRRLFEPGWAVKAAFGGRSSTKSTCMTIYLIVKALSGQTKYLCAREHFSNIKLSMASSFGDCAAMIGVAPLFSVQGFEVKGPNGSIFPFKGLDKDPDAVKSASGLDGVWIEEAEKINHMSFTKLMDTIRKQGSEILISANRESEEAPVDDYMYRQKPDDALLIESTYEDNPYLTMKEARKIRRDYRRDKPFYEWNWGGGPYMRPDAMAISRWEVGNLDQEAKRSGVPIYGLDWGDTAPTALIEMFVLPPLEPDGAFRLYISDEVYESRVDIDDMFAVLFGDDEQVPPRWANPEGHRGIPYAANRPIMCDPEDPKMIRHLKSRGIWARGAIKGKGSVNDGIRRLRTYDIIVHPDCRNAIKELSNYRFEVNALTGKPTSKVVKEDDHLCDAARYAIQGWELGRYPEWRGV